MSAQLAGLPQAEAKQRDELLKCFSRFQTTVSDTAKVLGGKCTALAEHSNKARAVATKVRRMVQQLELVDALKDVSRVQNNGRAAQEHTKLITAMATPGIEQIPLDSFEGVPDLKETLHDIVIYICKVLAAWVDERKLDERLSPSHMSALLLATRKVHKLLADHGDAALRAQLLEVLGAHVDLQTERLDLDIKALCQDEQVFAKALHMHSVAKRAKDHGEEPPDSAHEAHEIFRDALSCAEAARQHFEADLGLLAEGLLEHFKHAIDLHITEASKLGGKRSNNHAIWAKNLAPDCSWEQLHAEAEKTLLKHSYTQKIQSSIAALQEDRSSSTQLESETTATLPIPRSLAG